jgi:hypothetical protein
VQVCFAVDVIIFESFHSKQAPSNTGYDTKMTEVSTDTKVFVENVFRVVVDRIVVR